MSRSPRTPMRSPAFPDIPIYLDTGDERITAKTYGTTPTTPTTPDIIPPQRPTHLSPSHINAPPISPAEPSPTTTIETSSCRSIIWPIPEPPPEVQYQQDSRRPTLRFFPTQRPRIRLDDVHSLQIPSINEKTPITEHHPGLGINGLPKPPSIEISPPNNGESDSGPNIAQRIEETLWRYSASGNVLKRWLLELVSWLFSAVCMAAVIGVLIKLKDEPLTKWALAEKTGLTLNAYISILSKMAGAALILPVSEALGQLKWSWFLEHSKQMWDFEIFDNASRGPWGSLLLLVRTKGKALAALGAMIMLCSLALDPFFQQVVDFPDRWALQEKGSTIPRVVDYRPAFVPAFLGGFEMASEDRALASVAREFFYENGTTVVPFGNDWIGPPGDMPYPNGTLCGYFLNATSDAPIFISGYVADAETQSGLGEALLVRTVPLTDFDTKMPLYGAGSIKFKSRRHVLFDALIASAAAGPSSVYEKKAPIVHECVLSWCVQTIKSSYEYGQYNENITSTFLDDGPGPASWPWESFDTEGGVFFVYAQNITIEPPAASRSPLTIFNETYQLDNYTAMNALTYFDDFFPSYYTAENTTATPRIRYRNFEGGPTSQEMVFNAWEAPNNVTHHVERLATAMTNVIRSSPSKKMINGEAYSRENYVSVRWEWLTLPLGLLCISFIFLAATVAKSAVERDRVGVWKTSAYATLLYGLPDEMQQKITRSGSTGTPRAKAKELKVKLQPNHGWRVSGNLFSPFVSKPRSNQPPPGWI
ncbi:uncharacterized protein J4E92_007251 [Alternaria infectoria]|uniref:uncharacterized protein n=1 Tax=Alternaria infectoria TaxID=45303 RepID=UPI00221E9F62|nr:uncharacterized protein J4E92_007251 [Alternaria infectoria]KAI4924170.1 hypothetical protein J4E92_007251 [Alternaria infectoria]